MKRETVHDHPRDDDAPTHSFDKDYWERHWEQTPAAEAAPEAPVAGSAPNPYLVRAADKMVPGTALDAGCGTGAEAVWLASRGWQVTGADISDTALAQAAERAAGQSVSGRVRWIQADLVSWQPDQRFDLVTTNYAHPAMPQLAFYVRIRDWVAPGGTLLIVGHGHGPAPTGHTDNGQKDNGQKENGHPPVEATVTLAGITRILDPEEWIIQVAEEQARALTGPDGHAHILADVVVQATRKP